MSETLKELPLRVYELVDQQGSSYILEGTEYSDPVRLTAPSICRIPNESVMVVTVEGKKRFERIRYIRGCHTISKKEQEDMGFKPNMQVGADEINFENGKLLLADSGEMSTIINYLDNCALNVSNPDRREDATPVFRELKKAEEAQRSIDDFFTHSKAIEYLKKLVNQTGTGKSASVQYKEEKIDYLCSLFGINGLESMNEKFHALINMATAVPEKFLNSVADLQAGVTVDVNQALQYGVIAFDGDRVIFGDGNKFITTIVEKNHQKRLKELIDYFMSNDAKVNYDQMLITLQYKKNMALTGKQKQETEETK